MSNWYNKSGRPLSSVAWLEAHHLAKLPERTIFAQRIASHNPKRIVDLGCGPGIWLDLLSQHVSHRCELFGLDSDTTAAAAASARAKNWQQYASFSSLDIDSQPEAIPDADIYLAFNVFPYVCNIGKLLDCLRTKLKPNGRVIVRQYDGSLLRLGPMNQRDRLMIDTSLQSSVIGSQEFMHYDLDRVFEAIGSSCFESKEIQFEVFERIAPYPDSFLAYFKNTIDWTLSYISEDAANRLRLWFNHHMETGFKAPSYFSEVDMVAWLS